VIADKQSPLALAGIKGGTKAAVTSATRNLILEAASFNPSYIRKTAERLGIRTDASKRFENKLSPEMAAVGMNDFTAFLFESDKNIKVGEVVDRYTEKQKWRTIAVTADFLIRKIGLNLSVKEIGEVLERLLIRIEKKGDRLVCTPPPFRMDLNIPEDIAEEVARIIGYDKIPSALPPKTKGETEIPKSFYYEWKIREILVNEGFSEVMTSSFSEKGSVAIEKPLAEDKRYLRVRLSDSMWNSLEMNSRHGDFLDLNVIKTFEMGKVFSETGESLNLVVGSDVAKRRNGLDAMTIVKEAFVKLKTEGLGLHPEIRGNSSIAYGEVNLDELFEKLPLAPDKWNISISPANTVRFTPFSLYPFIVRDVALFVPSNLKPEAVAEIIKENAGGLVVRGPGLFDEFSKDGKKSFAFRLVFQSFDRTLSDSEVNASMEKVYSALKAKGWEVR
jgi:phenylalanyl-tRNA synthetase beta chain